jgi:hypothetical protein
MRKARRFHVMPRFDERFLVQHLVLQPSARFGQGLWDFASLPFFCVKELPNEPLHGVIAERLGLANQQGQFLRQLGVFFDHFVASRLRPSSQWAVTEDQEYAEQQVHDGDDDSDVDEHDPVVGPSLKIVLPEFNAHRRAARERTRAGGYDTCASGPTKRKVGIVAYSVPAAQHVMQNRMVDEKARALP